jgi:hypothetical protein
MERKEEHRLPTGKPSIKLYKLCLYLSTTLLMNPKSPSQRGMSAKPTRGENLKKLTTTRLCNKMDISAKNNGRYILLYVKFSVGEEEGVCGGKELN